MWMKIKKWKKKPVFEWNKKRNECEWKEGK